MGVELNFLVKKKREMPAGRVIVLVASLVFVIGASVLYMQWVGLSTESQVAAADVQAPGAPQDAETKRAAMELQSLQSDAVQHVALYRQLTETLGDGAIVRTFDYDGGESLQVNVNFPSFDAVSQATGQLERLPYIAAIQTGDATETGNGMYNAALTIEMNPNGLRVLNRNRGPQ